MGPNHEYLLDIFPVCSVQAPGNESKDRQENQDPNANANTGILRRLGHPLQVVDQIANGLVVLQRCHGARLDCFPTCENLNSMSVFLALFIDGHTLALKFPKGVGHAHVGESQIVPASWLGFVAIVGAEVGVQIICTGTAMT